MTEYVVYTTQLKKSEKGQLPDTYNIYLCGSLYNPSYSVHLNEAEKFYDIEEALETADLLAMQVGEIEIRVTRYKGPKPKN